MAANLGVERLTPLDLVMANVYTSQLVLFRTTEPLSAVTETLQRGLDALCKQVPWLSGRVYPTEAAPLQRPGVEIRWTTDDKPPVLANKGLIPLEYDSLAAAGMPPSSIPDHVWPVPNTNPLREHSSGVGAPVLAVSVFGFGDNQGLGLCVSMLHSAGDAAGFDQLLRLWASHVRTRPAATTPCPVRVEDRQRWLPRALAPDLDVVSTASLRELFALHPEYTTSPPTPPPAVFPPSACRVLEVPLRQIDLVKEHVAEHMAAKPSTNTILTALLWSAVSRVREKRSPALASETSELMTAVNGRRHLIKDSDRTEGQDVYLGNVVSNCLVRLPVIQVSAAHDEEDGRALAALCEVVSGSTRRARCSRRHFAEIYSLIDRVDDYRMIRQGWNWFGSRDFATSSWANFEIYSTDFGPQLGRPDRLRLRAVEGDGNAIILPRRRRLTADDTPEEVLEVMLLLRQDDMEALGKDGLWSRFVQGPVSTQCRAVQ